LNESVSSAHSKSEQMSYSFIYSITSFQELVRIEEEQLSINELEFQETPMISIIGEDLLDKLNLQIKDIAATDRFNFKTKIVLTNGATFQRYNNPNKIFSSSNAGFYNFFIEASCQSDLEGTFSYETTQVWCSNESDTLRGEVSIVRNSFDNYTFEDWSFGAYMECFGFGVGEGNMNFTDYCGEITFNDLIDFFGDQWTIASVVDGNRWTISWSNTSEESGVTTLFYPNGEDWPIVDR